MTELGMLCASGLFPNYLFWHDVPCEDIQILCPTNKTSFPKDRILCLQREHTIYRVKNVRTESIPLQKTCHVLNYFYRNRLRVHYSLMIPHICTQNKEKTSERDTTYLLSPTCVFYIFITCMCQVCFIFNFPIFILSNKFYENRLFYRVFIMQII